MVQIAKLFLLSSVTDDDFVRWGFAQQYAMKKITCSTFSSFHPSYFYQFLKSFLFILEVQTRYTEHFRVLGNSFLCKGLQYVMLVFVFVIVFRQVVEGISLALDPNMDLTSKAIPVGNALALSL